MNRSLTMLIMFMSLVVPGSVVQADAGSAGMEERIKQLETQIASQQVALDEMKADLKAKEDDTRKAMIETAQKETAKEFKKANLTGFKFFGDVRVRYDGTYWEENALPDRNTYRLRMRFGFSKNIGYGITGTVRFASGATTIVAGADLGGQPTSPNQTMGSSFERKGLWLDQAFLAWTPDIEGHFFTFAGGKFANPYFSTPMIWDTDVNPEGFYEKLNYKIGAVEPFLVCGQMIVKENALKADAYTLAYQGGVNLKAEKASLTLALAYYDWERYSSNFKYSNGNTTSNTGGSTFLNAVNFHILDFLAQGKIDAWRYPLELFVDYARNLDAEGPYAGQDTAWSIGGKIGRNKAQKDWSIAYRYARIDPNGVVGAFADSDFGYANRKGSEVMFKFNIYDPLVLGVSYWHTQPVVELARDSWNRLFIDLEYKF